MYEVFLNDIKIAIATKPVRPDKHADKRLVSIKSTGEVPVIVDQFLESQGTDLFLVCTNEEETWSSFRNCFLNIRAAGGVVKNEQDALLFIYRKGKWDLPKGKIEKGEQPYQTAIREVEEECGLSNLAIVQQLVSTWHIYKSPYPKTRGRWILKEIVWFEMHYAGEGKTVPQTEEGITAIDWIRPENSYKILANTYPNLGKIIRLYF